MKKIILATSYPLIDSNAAKERVLTLTNIIKKKNHVTIFCPGNKNKRIKKDKITFEYIKHDLKTNLLIFKLINEIIFLIKFCFFLLQNKNNFDYLIVTIPSMFLHLCSYFFSKKKILDVRDITWEYFNSNNLKYLFKKIFINSISNYDFILSTNTSQKKYLEKNFGFKKNIIFEIIPNGISEKRFKIIKKIKIKKTKNKKVLYVGNIGRAQNLSNLIMASSKLRDVKFTIIGNGSDFDLIKKQINELKLKNVNLLKGMKWNKLKKFYDNCDLLYAQILPEYDSAIPSKIYEYAATNKKVIFACKGISESINRIFYNFTIIEPLNEDILIQTINNKLKDTNLTKSNLHKIKKKYIREIEAKKVISKIIK